VTGPKFFAEALAEYEDAVRHEALLLVAVFHARRRPGYWLERLNQLGR
jgi:hypothetical protein